ncbi:hypothetical protein G6L32_14570 [Agrobacterium tumefaciens]|uniref:hypothetical protein n=1 Tax=Agrobacterium tumefaciens TaxID=358 RepID=UPI0015717B24|nr:hypothetical protein [Agrobacterium tumefaciens]
MDITVLLNRQGVNEQGLTELLGRGGTLMVQCIFSPEQRANNLHGAWVLRVSEDGGVWSLLEFSTRKQARVFRTASALSRFLLDKGFSVCAMPYRKGESVEISKDGRYRYNVASHS